MRAPTTALAALVAGWAGLLYGRHVVAWEIADGAMRACGPYAADCPPPGELWQWAYPVIAAGVCGVLGAVAMWSLWGRMDRWRDGGA